MLHEILLSLSGHSSPILTDTAASQYSSGSTLTPPERDLLADLARLADLHVRLRAHAAHIAAIHPSVVCRAAAAAVISVHLAAFQRDVLAVESTVLRRDAALVGAYDIVPLTAVVGAFADWPRRMEWLWAVATYILPIARVGEESKTPAPATSSSLIDHLRAELLTGYEDIERTARSLIRVAETAWLKQVSAWILYGRLPFDGSNTPSNLKNDDFFVQQQESTADTTGEYICLAQNLPSFVTSATAASMLFIGRSLVHLRAKTDSNRQANGPKASHWLAQDANADSDARSGFAGAHLSSQLEELAKLTYPLDGATFSRTIAHIRAFLSRTALRKLLPPSKVVDMLQLLRDFYLLGRGEFAMALVEQADETMRSRWQRADAAAVATSSQNPKANTLTPSGARGMKAVIVKDGEVAAVLARTWAMLGAMSGKHANDDQGEEEDEGMELARETLRLVLQKGASANAAVSTFTTPHNLRGPRQKMLAAIASTPFQNLLFSVPASLTLQIPYPLDLVLSTADLQAYSAIHAYLLSIRRAHIRLTGLWKLSSIRRHHPPPPAPPYGGSGRYRLEQVQMLRARYTERANALRSVWATTSAAIFFLAELEGYLQMEVVVELWDGFREWLGEDASENGANENKTEDKGDEDGDIWMAEAAEPARAPRYAHASATETESAQIHDPQSLATAHRRYLRQLVRRLLLDQGLRWTEPLYALLVSVDQLSALVHRLQSLWQALDLEADAGVVDAFVDLEREQQDALDALAGAEQNVRQGVLSVVGVLRGLEREADDRGDVEDGEDDDYDDDDREARGGSRGGGLGLRPAGAYVPRRIGGLDRLLMKLDFGSWGG